MNDNCCKMQAKTYPRLDEATLFVENLQIFNPESPVLFQKQSCQILYQVVEGKRSNQPSPEISMYSNDVFARSRKLLTEQKKNNREIVDKLFSKSKFL